MDSQKDVYPNVTLAMFANRSRVGGALLRSSSNLNTLDKCPPATAHLLSRQILFTQTSNILSIYLGTAAHSKKISQRRRRPIPRAMAFPSLAGLLPRRSLLLYAAAWTAVATTAVAVAACAPELAFVWAVGPGTPLSRACGDGTSVGLPLDGPPWDVVCLQAGMFSRAPPDIIVPLVFAMVVVAGAVWFTTAIGVWEDDDGDDGGESLAAATMDLLV